MQRQGIGKIIEQRVERAGKGGKEAGEREGEPDLAFDRDRQEARAALIFADRPQRVAEGGADQDAEQGNRHGEYGQQEEVESRSAVRDVERERAEADRFAMKISQAVEPAGEVVPTV